MYQGNVTVIKHGLAGTAQVRYRLAGTTVERDAQGREKAITPEQVAYRLGHQADSRKVVFIGAGGTAERLGYRPGEQLTAADQQTVERAMAGRNVETGLPEVAIKTRAAAVARVDGKPIYDVIVGQCAAAGVSAEDVFTGRGKGGSAEIWGIISRRADRLGDGFSVSVGDVQKLINTANRRENGPQLSAEMMRDALPEGQWDTAVEHNGERIAVGNAGYDMTFTAPKSFSLVAISAMDDAGRQEYMRALEDAITGATDALMDRVGLVGLGHRGDGETQQIVRADGYAATISLETYSRAEDPHFHGHVMIVNRLAHIDEETGEQVEHAFLDGGRSLIAHSGWFQAEAMRRLREITTERGLVTSWGLDPETDVWECNGIGRETRQAFSRMQTLMTAGGQAMRAGEWEGSGADDERGKQSAFDRFLRGKEKPAADVMTQAVGAGAVRKPSKGTETLTLGELWEITVEHAKEAGIDIKALHKGRETYDPRTQPAQWSVEEWARNVEFGLCENRAITSANRVEGQIRAWAPTDWSDEQIYALKDQILTTHFMVSSVGETWDPRLSAEELREINDAKRQYMPFGSVDSVVYASRRIYEAEEKITQRVTAGIGMSRHNLDHETAAAALEEYLAIQRDRGGRITSLTDGQRALYYKLVADGDLVGAVVGTAGSGKTTAVDAARYALTVHGGQRIYGVSTAALAAQTLGQEAGFDASSAAKLLNQIRFDLAGDDCFVEGIGETKGVIMENIRKMESGSTPKAREAAALMRERLLPPKMDRLMVDEASMMGAADMAELLSYAGDRGIQVTLIGDPKQLGAVAASGVFKDIAEATNTPILTENLRQKTARGQEVAALVRDGEVQAALEILADAGDFVAVRTQQEKYDVLAEYWEQHARQGADVWERMDTILEAARNDEVQVLNSIAAEKARAHGWTSGRALHVSNGADTRDYRVGEQIVITQNLRKRAQDVPVGHATQLLNGTRAVVTGIDPKAREITLTWREKDDRGIEVERTGTLTGRQIVDHTRLGYALTGHKTQGQTVAHIGVDLGADRDASATYVAVTRAKHGSKVVVNIADLIDGDEYRTVAKLGDRELQEWAATYVGQQIQKRGHLQETTAHGALEKDLFPDQLDGQARPFEPWHSRPHGRLDDRTLGLRYQQEAQSDAPNRLLMEALGREMITRSKMDPSWAQRETTERSQAARAINHGPQQAGPGLAG